MPADPVDFEQIAISRDLARKPEVVFLARVLYSIATTEPVAATPPPIYIILAHKIINKPGAMASLTTALEICNVR